MRCYIRVTPVKHLQEYDVDALWLACDSYDILRLVVRMLQQSLSNRVKYLDF